MQVVVRQSILLRKAGKQQSTVVHRSSLAASVESIRWAATATAKASIASSTSSTPLPPSPQPTAAGSISSPKPLRPSASEFMANAVVDIHSISADASSKRLRVMDYSLAQTHYQQHLLQQKSLSEKIPRQHQQQQKQSLENDPELSSSMFPNAAPKKATKPQYSEDFQEPISHNDDASSKSRANFVAPQDAVFFASERRAFIGACLANGDIGRAEKIFNRAVSLLATTNPPSKITLIERGMVNAFIEAAFQSSPPDSNKALEWHKRARKYNLSPDVSTYALLVHNFLITQNNMPAAAKLISEMKFDGLEPALLFGDRRFAELEDCATLSILIRSMKNMNIDLSKVENERQVAELILKSAKEHSTSDFSSPLSLLSNQSDTLVLSALQDSNESKSSLANSAAAADTSAATNTPVENSDLVATNSLGVRILQRTLESISLKTESSINNSGEKKSLAELLKLQSELEKKALTAAVEELAATHEDLPENLRSIISLPTRYMATWNRLLIPAIKSGIAKLESSTEDADHHGFVPFLKLLTPEQLAKIAITEFLRISSADNGQGVSDLGSVTADTESDSRQAVATVAVLSRIGTAIEMEYNLQQLNKKKNQKMFDTQKGIHNLHINGRLFNTTMRKVISDLAQKEAIANEKNNWIPKWPSSTKVRAASFLAVLLVDLAKVQVPHPNPEDPRRDILVEERAFEHTYAAIGTKNIGVIKMHPYILEKLSTDPVHVHPRLLPMVVPPRPWLTHNSGGYLHYKSEVLRTRSSEHRAYLREADKNQHLAGVYESLDVLGKTPWRVNERVYEVVKKLWNSGESIADLPPIPDEKEDAYKKKPRPDNWNDMSSAEKKAWNVEQHKQMSKRRNDFSQRCDTNYKIEIARSFLGQTIYFPHNMDFRGRAYPMPAHLNHMGNDFCRGLLMFDTKKQLGERGLRWLKIQVANLMGNNKITFDEREKYADDNMDNILDSADHPLDGKRWWLTAEDPWQMLATCFELAEAWRSPDATKFMSRIPVHQDGTCNGLQHYAALGGDELGAKQVNLMPTDRPGDIYSAVSDRVSAAIDKLVEGGDETAKLMQAKVTRKLVKQTVMTNTYGVTFIGARDQVKSRIRENPELYPFTDEQIGQCSLQITHLIFDSLGELFTGARALQNWLNSTALMIAKSIPAASIPQIQLDDAAFLSKIGCLPSAFTVARAEVKEVSARERKIEDIPKLAQISGIDELNMVLLDAATDEEIISPVIHVSEDEMFDFLDKDDDAAYAASKQAESDLSAIAAKAASASQQESKIKVEKLASVIWTTPLGLPIVQPYRDQKKRSIQTLLQTVTIVDNTTLSAVNPMKQSTAFPPNFIHSLDATHMMLSAIKCNQEGIDFAAVHDSYWTHACDVDKMAEVLRETFVTLHSKNIMQNLREELRERNETHKYGVNVEINDPEKITMWQDHLRSTGRKVYKKSSKSVKVTSWVNLVIPPLPAKGDFNIEHHRIGEPVPNISKRELKALQNSIFMFCKSWDQQHSSFRNRTFNEKEKAGMRTFKVSLGSYQSCNCRTHLTENDLCVHILWVMIKVFRVGLMSEILYQNSLIEREICELMDVRKKILPTPTAASPEDRIKEDSQKGTIKQRPIEEGDLCRKNFGKYEDLKKELADKFSAGARIENQSRQCVTCKDFGVMTMNNNARQHTLFQHRLTRSSKWAISKREIKQIISTSQLNELQNRELGPEDYEILLNLDEHTSKVLPKTGFTPLHIISLFPLKTLACGDTWLLTQKSTCPVCNTPAFREIGNFIAEIDMTGRMEDASFEAVEFQQGDMNMFARKKNSKTKIECTLKSKTNSALRKSTPFEPSIVIGSGTKDESVEKCPIKLKPKRLPPLLMHGIASAAESDAGISQETAFSVPATSGPSGFRSSLMKRKFLPHTNLGMIEKPPLSLLVDSHPCLLSKMPANSEQGKIAVDPPEAQLLTAIKTFRFPDPATTSMGIDFSDSEADDEDTETNDGTNSTNSIANNSVNSTNAGVGPGVFRGTGGSIARTASASGHTQSQTRAHTGIHDARGHSNIFRTKFNNAAFESASDSDSDNDDDYDYDYSNSASNVAPNFNPFKPISSSRLSAAASSAPSVSVPNANTDINTGAPSNPRFSSADLKSEIVALEKLMMSEESKDLPSEVHEMLSSPIYLPSSQPRRRSSAAVIDEYLKSKEETQHRDDGDQEIKAQRDSYRKSTQSLLQFLLDSRQAISMAASSPIPSPNNIFRGTDFIVNNVNRMSTAISVQSSKGNRLSYAQPIYADNDSVESFVSHEDDLDLVERELNGELDSDDDDFVETDDDKVSDVMELQNVVPSPSTQQSPESRPRRDHIVQQSATLRLYTRRNNALPESAIPANLRPPQQTYRPRVAILKRPSIDIQGIPTSPASMTQQSPTTSTAHSLSPQIIIPDAKRRRSIPSLIFPKPEHLLLNPSPTTPSSNSGIPHNSHMRTTPPAPRRGGPYANIPAPTSTNTTLLQVIANLWRTHLTAVIPTVDTLLTTGSRFTSERAIAAELHTAAAAWRSREHSAAVYKLHACAVAPWVLRVDEEEEIGNGGITRATVHPSAVALYILAMCLFEGVAHVIKKDARLGILMLEMAAAVAIDDGGDALTRGFKDDNDGFENYRQQQEQQQQSGFRVPERRASLKRGIRLNSTASSGGVSHQENSHHRPVYYALADPAWSLIDGFGQGPSRKETPPTPQHLLTTSGGDAASAAASLKKSSKRISQLHSLTPIEFLRLPTLRLAECYELGRGVKKSTHKAAYFYQVWNALGGDVAGGTGTRGSVSSEHSSGHDFDDLSGNGRRKDGFYTSLTKSPSKSTPSMLGPFKK
ncbi:DNA-directed RNA polymerase [Physocladia obscura]|uniref:DNA-directed RNA polymerase n=1 Tax=Physocladia obscura TaxID=109957 RepID=A0AAD5T5V3_9FUNG|nr:DNA-directed RNA polymerase [Physocladia obscura]